MRNGGGMHKNPPGTKHNRWRNPPSPYRENGGGKRKNPPGSKYTSHGTHREDIYASGGVVRKGCGMWNSQIDCQQNGCSWNFDGPNCH